MAMNNKGKRNKSLCEKSMKMVTNIVKLSSFSIAKVTLGTSEPYSPVTKKLVSFSGSVKVSNGPPLPQFSGSQRAKEPESRSNPISYLIEPVEGNMSSSYVIREETSVDGKASDYIRRIHAKNRYDSAEASSISPYIMPPPPHVLM